jgi:hypothetical protein
MGDRWGDMKAFTGRTPPPGRSTLVAARRGVVITLATGGTVPLRLPREKSGLPLRRTDGYFTVPAGDSLRAVTGSHWMTSPVSGAVARGVMELTCSAISQSRLGEVRSPCPWRRRCAEFALGDVSRDVVNRSGFSLTARVSGTSPISTGAQVNKELAVTSAREVRVWTSSLRAAT